MTKPDVVKERERLVALGREGGLSREGMPASHSIMLARTFGLEVRCDLSKSEEAKILDLHKGFVIENGQPSNDAVLNLYARSLG